MCNYSIVFTTGNKCNNTFSGIKIVDYKFSKELLSKDIGESIIKSKEGEITQLSKLVTKKKMNDGKLLTIIMYLMPEGWVGKDATKQVFSNNYITQAFNDYEASAIKGGDNPLIGLIPIKKESTPLYRLKKNDIRRRTDYGIYVRNLSSYKINLLVPGN